MVARRRNANAFLSSRRIVNDDAIPRVGEPKHLARDFFDKVRIWQIWPEQGHVTLQFGAHGLEALDLELQSAFTLQQPVSRLEAVAAVQCVIGEVGRKT
jgi:hypothetical protein